MRSTTGLMDRSLARITAAGHRAAEATVAGSHGGAYPQLALTPGGDAFVAYTVTTGGARSVKAARVRVPG